tara:strand:+ start:642 stop:839 length:198 start_codon:yes stop_codon:yes gene_type:complete
MSETYNEAGPIKDWFIKKVGQFKDHSKWRLRSQNKKRSCRPGNVCKNLGGTRSLQGFAQKRTTGF